VSGETIDIVHEDGTRHELLMNATTLLDEAGQPCGAVAVGVEITEMNRAQERLRQLWQAVEQSPASVVITDTRGRVEYANPKFCEVSGYTAAEVVGSNTRLLKSGHTTDEEYRALWRTILSGGVWRGEFQNRRKDGSLFWEHASISGVKDLEGRITHFIGVKEDITERKRAEQALEQAQAQLMHSQKMEAIGRLAGGVAHDFNNLLGVIRGHADLMLKALPPRHPVRERVEQIQTATQRAAELSRQLLAFGRKQTLKVVVLQLETVVLEAESMLRRVIGEDVELTVAVRPGLPPVKADPLQVEQVLINLAVNARDAMPSGGRLAIELSALEAEAARAERLPPATHVALSVADSGCGMDEATLSRIFEPFFTTKDVGHGSGLGLATVYGIVTQLGGEIRVSSAPGAGTTFRVYLPATEGVVERAAPAATPELLGGGETILLVEDEPGLRRLTGELLESLGYRVLQASGGEEALGLAATHDGPLHLLLTDVVMPGVGGPELARRLRSLRPELPVVLMSGYAANQVAEGALGPGTRLLDKPFRMSELAAVLHEMLSARSDPR
jgi:two-component system cell cycle sensor histidine kinase/response regulator CckA